MPLLHNTQRLSAYRTPKNIGLMLAIICLLSLAAYLVCVSLYVAVELVQVAYYTTANTAAIRRHLALLQQAGTVVALHGEKALAVSLMAMRQLAIMLLMALRYLLTSQVAITARVATLVARVAMIVNMSPLQQDKVTP
nr:MAG TPA: hypothetical protein [Caudoviricetes sp.]